MMRSELRSCSGFTLLELLVAIAIFAFLGAMAYGGLTAMLRSADGSVEARERLAALQRGLRILDDDLTYVVQRGARDGLGSPRPAFLGSNGEGILLELTRSVRPNEALAPAPLERVRYVLREQAVLRESWNPPDAARLEPDTVLTLWPQIETIAFEFLDSNMRPHPVWPPPNAAEPNLMPRAVALQLSPKQGESYQQLSLLPEFPLAPKRSPSAATKAASNPVQAPPAPPPARTEDD